MFIALWGDCAQPNESQAVETQHKMTSMITPLSIIREWVAELL